MLSQKGRYALHALFVLAERGGDEPMLIADIAEAAHVPRKFLEQILVELKKRGIVRSQRGRAGGYQLGRAPKDISFADVIRVTDGPLALSPCVSVTAYHRCGDCLDEKTCVIRKALLLARDATAQALESRTLASVLKAPKSGIRAV
jgi:Rrf2 family protein